MEKQVFKVLERIVEENDDFIDWNIIKGFFSRRGRPVDIPTKAEIL